MPVSVKVISLSLIFVFKFDLSLFFSYVKMSAMIVSVCFGPRWPMKVWTFQQILVHPEISTLCIRQLAIVENISTVKSMWWIIFCLAMHALLYLSRSGSSFATVLSIYKKIYNTFNKLMKFMIWCLRCTCMHICLHAYIYICIYIHKQRWWKSFNHFEGNGRLSIRNFCQGAMGFRMRLERHMK